MTDISAEIGERRFSPFGCLHFFSFVFCGKLLFFALGLSDLTNLKHFAPRPDLRVPARIQPSHHATHASSFEGQTNPRVAAADVGKFTACVRRCWEFPGKRGETFDAAAHATHSINFAQKKCCQLAPNQFADLQLLPKLLLNTAF